MKLILASASPYRALQLKEMTYDFQCEKSGVDEDRFKNKGLDPKELTRVLAFEKALAVQKKYPNDTIIGADQICLSNGQILGKPFTKQKALKQLLSIQGKSHELISSLCVLIPQKKYEHTDITRIYMRELSEEQLKNYIEAENPVNCAGSCKIERAGISLFRKIESQDQSSVIGLPLIKLCNILFENKIYPKAIQTQNSQLNKKGL